MEQTGTVVPVKMSVKAKESILSQFLKLLCSVRLGIALLCLLALACMIGMLIMQENVEGFANYYVSLTPAQQLVYGKLGFFDIYQAWYFNALLALLSLNIILSSIDRFPKTRLLFQNHSSRFRCAGCVSKSKPIPFRWKAREKKSRTKSRKDLKRLAGETRVSARKAVEFLQRANKIKPDDYETIVNLGNAYFDSGKYEDAEKWYSAALAKKTDDVNARTDMGLTFIFREPPNFDRAIQEFTRVLEKAPNHPQALQNLTVAYTKKGDAEKAKLTLSRLEGFDSSSPALPKLREELQKLESK